MFEFQNKLLFVNFEPSLGYELWQWDGANSPALVYDINPGSDFATPVWVPRRLLRYLVHGPPIGSCC